MPAAIISAKGWIVIPAEFRRKYALMPGHEVAIVDYGGVLSVVPTPADPVAAGFGLLAGGKSLTKSLLEERRRDRRREETHRRRT